MNFTYSVSLIIKTRKKDLEAQRIELREASYELILIGIAAGALDSLDGEMFGLFYLGLSWIFTGGIYLLAGRDVTKGGFLAALVFGFLGAIIWVVVDIRKRRSADTSFRYSGKQAHYKRIAESNYTCGDCLWFGKPACPRNETQINAEPCASFIL